MPYLATQIAFSAAHHYWRSDWLDEKNHETFGLCANREGHGHNYLVDVCLAGSIQPEKGMLINFFDLEPLLKARVIEPLDHKNLNTQVPYFSDKIPTLENIACYIWEQLAPAVKAYGLRLHRIKVTENRDLYVEYDGVAA
jgi:6-pyruvoyltetrahydropterin/6-carboxytetrahydropterin synthase